MYIHCNRHGGHSSKMSRGIYPVGSNKLTCVACLKENTSRRKYLGGLITVLTLVVGITMIMSSTVTTKNKIEQVTGVRHSSFVFPAGPEVFDPQWSGESVSFVRCTAEVDDTQKVYASLSENHLYVYYNSYVPAGAYCWQVAENTDPAKVARIASWWMRNASVAGYESKVFYP